jgi:hypothetical protein
VDNVVEIEIDGTAAVTATDLEVCDNVENETLLFEFGDGT